MNKRKKKRRRRQPTAKARITDLLINILAGTISGLITAAIARLLNW